MKKIIILFFIFFLTGCGISKEETTHFLASNLPLVSVLNLDYEEVLVNRGQKVTYKGEVIEFSDVEYMKVYIEDKEFLVSDNQLVNDKENVVLEELMYVRTPVTVYNNNEDSTIKSFIKKGEELMIVGYDELLDDGTVTMYEIEYGDINGYVYSKYLVNTHSESLVNYDEEGIYKIHAGRKNTLGGGAGANLDFFPREKPNFSTNPLPGEVRALYLTINSIRRIDEYIDFAKENNINGLVIDIKDNTMPGYKSEVMKQYSPTNYERAANSFDAYQKAIQKVLDADLYAIGRITIFKDSYFVRDNPDSAIMDKRTNEPLRHNNSNWPSAFDRNVWEFNVLLAKEAVREMGFNEIQFDYVRFPDRINKLEADGFIDLKNKYDEDKATAIQNFLMYATDEIHKEEAYVSADVFGESAHTYVTAYGQYWPAISNVVDVISAMPYPDHFSAYEYGLDKIVWTTPYELLLVWGDFAAKRQTEIPTPALSRTWLQVYNAIRPPYNEYGSKEVSLQIKALYETGHTGGFMTWNASANLNKYEDVKEAFSKEYE